MKKTKLIAFAMAGIAAAFVTSCSEDPIVFDAPTIEVGGDGIVDGQITAKLGEDVTITIAAVTDAEFASITITEYQGVTELSSEVSTTQVTSYTHTVTVEDATEPFRINFLVTDIEGITASADVIISGELTSLYKLQTFGWRFASQISVNDPLGLIVDGTDNIRDDQKDDTYVFNEDGTAAVIYGEVNDGFENLLIPGSYDFDEETQILKVYRVAFQPDWSYAPKDTLTYDIQEFTDTQFTGRIVYPLGELLGAAPEDWLWTADDTFTAVEKIQ